MSQPYPTFLHAFYLVLPPPCSTIYCRRAVVRDLCPTRPCLRYRGNKQIHSKTGDFAMRRTTHTAIMIVIVAASGLRLAANGPLADIASPISRHPAGSPVQERAGFLRRTSRLSRGPDVVPGCPAGRALPRHVLDLLSGRPRPGECNRQADRVGRVGRRHFDSRTPPGQPRPTGPAHDRRQGSRRHHPLHGPQPGRAPARSLHARKAVGTDEPTGRGNNPSREACSCWRRIRGNCPSTRES